MADWSNCMDRSRGKCMHCMNWSCRMVDWCNCMMDWSSSMVDCMVGSWSNMEWSGMVWNCHGMDGCGMVEGSSMVSNSMMNRSSMVGNSMVGWSCMVGNRVVDRGCVVSNGMVGCSMVDHSMVGVRMGDHRRWDNVSVLVQDGFWQVWVEQGVCVEAVEGDGSAAVNCVPELAPEQVLVEECSVGADEAGSLRSVPPVVADAIRLTSGFRVSVHAGGEGDAGAAELSVGGVGMAGVVDAGMANCPVLVVLRLVVRLWLMVGGRGVVGCRCNHRGMICWRCWFMVGWRRGGIWCRLMVDWRGWCVGGRFNVGRGRWCIGSWWWWWRGIRCRGRGIWLRGMDYSRGVGGRGGGIGGGNSPKVSELREPLDPLVFLALLHLLAVKTVKACVSLQLLQL